MLRKGWGGEVRLCCVKKICNLHFWFHLARHTKNCCELKEAIQRVNVEGDCIRV